MNEGSPNRLIGVLLPLAVEKPYTYLVPAEMSDQIMFGMSVEVQFGKARHYAGIVVETEVEVPDVSKVKPILHVLDEKPLITPLQYRLWQWISEYYACSLGEVMSAALPSHLKMSSETRIIAGPRLEEEWPGLDDTGILIAEAVITRKELKIDDVRIILGKKNVYPVLQPLMHLQVIAFQEELVARYKPKRVTAVKRGSVLMNDDGSGLQRLLEGKALSPKQTDLLLAFLHLEKQFPWVSKSVLLEKSGASEAVFKALCTKAILETYPKSVTRLNTLTEEDATTWILSAAQQEALVQIKQQLVHTPVVLLEGITGSGKTLIYTHLINETLRKGKQVLYLLPEIALTTQLILRLEQLIGRNIQPYHSRLNQHERVEIWNAVFSQPDMFVVSPRSGLFLPWSNLGLVIVDEEHDPSFKQNDPAPRYHGRDVAIMLAHMCKAPAVLGSATPSLESWYHAQQRKYGHVKLDSRFGKASLPEIEIVNLRHFGGKNKETLFSPPLLQAIESALTAHSQVLLFQNRRGYAPNLICETCAWVQECAQCDVALNFHRLGNMMHCHYCGYQTKIPVSCPKCGNRKLLLRGFGTQRIEDDLQIYFPHARVGRLDMDTARSRVTLAQLIDDFEERRLDILVGTQMISKGLDFGNLSLVGVLHADQLLMHNDFRSAERGYQLLVQVSGRAGRQDTNSKVIIQTWEPTHPVIQAVISNDQEGFYRRELEERFNLHYPPFTRIIRVLIKHKDVNKAEWAASELAGYLRTIVHEEKNVLGPATPAVGRVNSYYLRSIQIKTGPEHRMAVHIKRAILDKRASLTRTAGMSGLIIHLDVDPA